jgi:hypothetical protein
MTLSLVLLPEKLVQFTQTGIKNLLSVEPPPPFCFHSFLSTYLHFLKHGLNQYRLYLWIVMDAVLSLYVNELINKFTYNCA